MQLDQASSTSSRIAGSVQIIFIVALAVAWYLATEVGSVSRFLLPSPVAVVAALGGLVTSGELARQLGLTLYQVVVAFGLSAVVGLGTGFLVARSRYLVEVFTPIFSALFAVPVVLLLPLFVLIWGLGPESKIAAGVASCIFPIILSATVGFAKVERVYLTAARSMGASPWQLFSKVLMPAALPVILSGMRLGFVIAFLSVLGAETIASYAGIGRAIVESGEIMQTDRMYAFIVVVVALAFLINLVLSAIERRGTWR
jgi:ABC-type nitrate/sulfonate/bicarbonate transport system permease component